MGKTRPAETNDDSDCIQGKRPVSKNKKTCDDENLVQVLKESIAIREERERKQESDSDRLFMLSLLEDFKNIPKHRKLSTRMELIDVIKRAQMPFMEIPNLVCFAKIMLIMNQGHQPPDYLDQKNRLVDSIAMYTRLNMDRETRAVGNIAMNTQLNIGRKSRAVGNIAMDTRHSQIMGQKPRAVKAAVHILRMFQTSN
ncbi:unnamed protein product [Parnassius apollo]|uniref:(apollo) hypothetical protein n=1 Tax=Parnassius apollo TaxID=110799 RepID=A0A8S3XJB8_PARAO|nr:unnamed protein product [Parnassius apollo]